MFPTDNFVKKGDASKFRTNIFGKKSWELFVAL